MDQRTQFISDYLKKLFTFTELCQRYGISRKTGYKWVDRYLADGPAGLDNRSRAPHQIPHRTSQQVIDALLELRIRHPTWGAKKLLVKLAERQPGWQLPARSTVYDLLKPYGVVQPRRRRKFPGHPGKSQRQVLVPNDTWCADFKGQFRLGNSRYCYPLTITDQNSRYLLACQSLTSTGSKDAKAVFTAVFRE